MVRKNVLICKILSGGRRTSQNTIADRINSYALICFNYLASLVTVLLNSLVIFTIKPKRALQGNSNILWVCLVGSWMKPWFLQSLLNAKSGYVSRIKWILANSKHWKWTFLFFFSPEKESSTLDNGGIFSLDIVNYASECTMQVQSQRITRRMISINFSTTQKYRFTKLIPDFHGY